MRRFWNSRNSNRNGYTAYRACPKYSNSGDYKGASRTKCVCKIKRGKRIFKCGNLVKPPKGCKETA